MTGIITHYCYVPHAAWPLWTRLGWHYDSELGPPHWFYSSLYVWRGEGEPVMPMRRDESLAIHAGNRSNIGEIA